MSKIKGLMSAPNSLKELEPWLDQADQTDLQVRMVLTKLTYRSEWSYEVHHALYS